MGTTVVIDKGKNETTAELGCANRLVERGARAYIAVSQISKFWEKPKEDKLAASETRPWFGNVSHMNVYHYDLSRHLFLMLSRIEEGTKLKVNDKIGYK